jgi:hypothetical protein
MGREAFDFWRPYPRPRGYTLRFQVVDHPEGVPGDIGLTLSWL